MKSKGLISVRLVVGLIALFSLTIIYTYFDTVVEDKFYTDLGKNHVTDPRADSLLDSYLNGWQSWVPLFLIAIFIYTLAAFGNEGPAAGRIQQ